MRLIDGDALEKFLSDAEMEATKRKKYVFAGALNVIQGNVRNFPTIEPETNWISCKERLPEKRQEVIVTVNNGAIYTSGDVWTGTGFWAYGHYVIAWQPLPEPFKKEGEEE